MRLEFKRTSDAGESYFQDMWKVTETGERYLGPCLPASPGRLLGTPSRETLSGLLGVRLNFLRKQYFVDSNESINHSVWGDVRLLVNLNKVRECH